MKVFHFNDGHHPIRVEYRDSDDTYVWVDRNDKISSLPWSHVWVNRNGVISSMPWSQVRLRDHVSLPGQVHPHYHEVVGMEEDIELKATPFVQPLTLWERLIQGTE